MVGQPTMQYRDKRVREDEGMKVSRRCRAEGKGKEDERRNRAGKMRAGLTRACNGGREASFLS
jgi:hypothetical protein